jgi:AraC family transcriptional regulator, transcriptional activator of pobA
MGNILKIDSISQVHEVGGLDKPKHPLITLIENSQEKPISPTMPIMDLQIVSSLYSISLKDGHECQITYGRKNYDFQEGSLIFLAPGQTIIPAGKGDGQGTFGWVLCFHPDLIRKSSLSNKMNEYSFFSYDSHEALHVSEAERETVTNIVRAIRDEYSKNIDVYSQDLIVSNIELLLNHSKRFYGRQFITRTSANKDVLTKFEEYLKDYFDSDDLETKGLPSVKACAEAMGYSPNYLSDLLKKETGKNAQEHIHFYLIEQAKNLLLGTEEPVNRIAYSLGFEYPQHFSKLFKNKTGKTPAEFRN